MTEIFDATADLKEVAALAAEPEALEEVLARALDALQELVPHDMAAVLALDGDRLRVRAARGSLVNDAVRSHSLDLGSHPTIRRALETRRPIVLEEHDHTGAEKDPYHGIVDLPHGHSCMVVPLYTADRPLGLMTFDRVVCGTYDRSTVQLADAYGQVIALAIRFAEQADLLARYRRLLDERNRVLAHDAATGDGDQAVDMLEGARSPLVAGLVHQARQVALTDAPVLITGETGTGKEVLARAIHHWSGRRGAPFLQINCAAIPEHLIESELFGHLKGSFTGASKDRPGRFMAANGGTLLLDEIGDMPAAAQAKLLRVLQEGTFEPVGADRAVKVDVRILAATHRDLELLVADGSFREDLRYRLEVFPVHMPPLRERLEDLPALTASILERIAARTGRGPWTVGHEAVAAMGQQAWPGNVRQLVNALERATIFVPEGRLDARFFMTGSAAPPAVELTSMTPGTRTLAQVEREHLVRTLRLTAGRIYGEDGAAALLGMKPTTLQSRLKKHGIDRTAPV